MDKKSVLIWVEDESYRQYFEPAIKVFNELGVSFEFSEMSEFSFDLKRKKLIAGAVEAGVKIIICAGNAGWWSADLPHCVAGEVCGKGIAVIAVAIDTPEHSLGPGIKDLDWMDSGNPMALAGINENGALNAAVMAAEILIGSGVISGENIYDVHSRLRHERMEKITGRLNPKEEEALAPI